MENHVWRRGSVARKGYALVLGLLLVFVLGMVMYWTKMHGSVIEIGVGKSDINPPWRQWHEMQIRYRKSPIGQPLEQHPDLSKAVELVAKATNGEMEGGEVELVFMPDGSIVGDWKGTFDVAEDVDYQLMGSDFEGNIDPEQVYEVDGWEEPSRLFFICRGHFTILETNDGNGQVRNLGGYVYVRGWLDADYSVEGELIMTSDEKKFRRFTWSGKGAEGDGFGLGKIPGL